MEIILGIFIGVTTAVGAFYFLFDTDKIKEQNNLIIQKLNVMGERTDQALAELQAINEKLTKIGTETSASLQKITELEEAAANSDTPQEVLDAIAAVRSQAQVVDDLVTDKPTEPPVEP